MIDLPQNPDFTFKPGERLQRRVQGYHNRRLDGIADLLYRARNATVFDIGCNRGLVGYEFAMHGAARVMGCDNYENGITTARHVFADLRTVPHRFEVVDLAGGEAAVRAAFGADADMKHDIVLMLATYHKLRRLPELEGGRLGDLVRFFGARTVRFFGWRGYESELDELDVHLGAVGLQRVHTSLLSDIQPAAIWMRV